MYFQVIKEAKFIGFYWYLNGTGWLLIAFICCCITKVDCVFCTSLSTLVQINFFEVPSCDVLIPTYLPQYFTVPRSIWRIFLNSSSYMFSGDKYVFILMFLYQFVSSCFYSFKLFELIIIKGVDILGFWLFWCCLNWFVWQ